MFEREKVWDLIDVVILLRMANKKKIRPKLKKATAFQNPRRKGQRTLDKHLKKER